jgi:uncharacterized membrane-anchored protein YhcB (DUF1043 family)
VSEQIIERIVQNTGILFFVGGIMTGLVLGIFVLPRQRETKRLKARLEEMEAEHASYRGKVSEHFEETGRLFVQMTASYKAVYDHLAKGAHELTGLPPGAQTLGFSGQAPLELAADASPDAEPTASEAAVSDADAGSAGTDGTQRG